MGFNYGLEKRKFTEEWKKLYREYKAAGMSEEDIHSGRLQKFAALPPPRSAKRSQNSKNFCMGVNFCLFSLPTK